jgi:predicted O-methyltransferase YrrM
MTRVFEYGSGASTVWLARRAHEVHTVEHDVDFSATVTDLTSEYTNVTAYIVPPAKIDDSRDSVIRSERRSNESLDFTNYVKSIHSVDGRFDLIVIDGRARVACLRESLPRLKDGGIVVFDNILRKRYAKALDIPDTKATVFRGLTPCLPYPDSTAVIIRTA